MQLAYSLVGDKLSHVKMVVCGVNGGALMRRIDIPCAYAPNRYTVHVHYMHRISIG